MVVVLARSRSDAGPSIMTTRSKACKQPTTSTLWGHNCPTSTGGSSEQSKATTSLTYGLADGSATTLMGGSGCDGDCGATARGEESSEA